MKTNVKAIIQKEENGDWIMKIPDWKIAIRDDDPIKVFKHAASLLEFTHRTGHILPWQVEDRQTILSMLNQVVFAWHCHCGLSFVRYAGPCATCPNGHVLCAMTWIPAVGYVNHVSRSVAELLEEDMNLYGNCFITNTGIRLDPLRVAIEWSYDQIIGYTYTHHSGKKTKFNVDEIKTRRR